MHPSCCSLGFTAYPALSGAEGIWFLGGRLAVFLSVSMFIPDLDLYIF